MQMTYQEGINGILKISGDSPAGSIGVDITTKYPVLFFDDKTFRPLLVLDGKVVAPNSVIYASQTVSFTLSADTKSARPIVVHVAHVLSWFQFLQ